MIKARAGRVSVVPCSEKEGITFTSFLHTEQRSTGRGNCTRYKATGFQSPYTQSSGIWMCHRQTKQNYLYLRLFRDAREGHWSISSLIFSKSLFSQLLQTGAKYVIFFIICWVTSRFFRPASQAGRALFCFRFVY